MLPRPTIIVSDAHIGHAPNRDVDAFHRFLETVPTMGDHLVVNGDLFEFWFEYRSVIPRYAYPTLEALGVLRRAGVRITIMGGNHDRWGGDFWREQLGVDFHARSARLNLGGLRALVEHGDGMMDGDWGSRALHRLIGHPATARLFRWLHPDAGMALVRRLSPHLAGKARDETSLARAAQRQRAHAEHLLRTWKEVQLVVLGHTHRRQLVEIERGRWYLNPGAWVHGHCYARVTEHGPTLERFGGESYQ